MTGTATPPCRSVREVHVVELNAERTLRDAEMLTAAAVPGLVMHLSACFEPVQD
jgi:hypothetical protein